MRSGLPGLLNRAARITALTGLVAGSVLAFTATPAAATGALTTISPASWSYVDSAAPDSTFQNPSGDAPIGTQVDAAGVSHTTKAYFTFDLSQYRGTSILSATLSMFETAAADCTSTATPQMWATTQAGHATWRHQPTEESQLAVLRQYYNCPKFGTDWDAAQAMQDALDAGRSSVTIELRLPDGQQADPNNWRSYDPAVDIQFSYDHPPTKPTNLSVYYKACTNAPLYIGGGDVPMSAVMSDPDPNDWITAQFAFWPVHQPQLTTVVTGSGISGSPINVTAPPSDFTDNTTYALHVRGNDGVLNGPWSSICVFTALLNPPPNAPTVSSVQYPSGTAGGGSGEPGTFTFTGGTDPNIVSFDYQIDSGPPINVAADHDHNATIQYTPAKIGGHRMTVWSVDRAGNYSPQTNYDIAVANNEPNVSCTPESAYLGVTRQCTFSPRGTDVVGYVYNLNGGASTSLAPGPDGTATVSVTPTTAILFGGQDLNVQAKLANGNLTDTNAFLVDTDNGEPTVTPDSPNTVVGVPTQFTVTPVLPGSTSVTYSIDGVVAPTSVPVAPDGTATFTITPPYSGYAELDVFTTNADGIQSGTTEVQWVIQTNRPTVTSDDYPPYANAGGTGEPGTFVFSSPVAGVTSYTYVFDSGTPVTVPAGTDGTASVVLTPPNSDWQTLSVTSTLADGTTSEAQQYTFDVRPVFPTVSCPSSVTSGQQFSCTLTATQTGATSFTYSWNAGPNTSVPATNGTATITLTAPTVSSGSVYPQLLASSATAAGFNSDQAATTITVNPASGG